jgi:hypothetical protein
VFANQLVPQSDYSINRWVGTETSERPGEQKPDVVILYNLEGEYIRHQENCRLKGKLISIKTLHKFEMNHVLSWSVDAQTTRRSIVRNIGGHSMSAYL